MEETTAQLRNVLEMLLKKRQEILDSIRDGEEISFEWTGVLTREKLLINYIQLIKIVREVLEQPEAGQGLDRNATLAVIDAYANVLHKRWELTPDSNTTDNIPGSMQFVS